ncbi:MAG: aldose epimerase family protein [Planctomycetota bacterium]|jgi:aldose 1-epimerase
MSNYRFVFCIALTAVCLNGGKTVGRSFQKTQAGLGVKEKLFGRMPDGREVTLYELKNANGVRAGIINYGAILVSLEVSDRDGKFDDVALGFDDMDSYIQRNPLFGAVVGRYANRIANASFTLDGTEYKLTANAGKNHIHGGRNKRFDKVLWEGSPLTGRKEAGVRFTYLSKDGDEGFPGNLKCIVTYTLTNNNELKISYEATTDKPTIINLTNHSYFNLAGAGNGDVLDHEMIINADYYTPSDTALIPTGEIHNVKDTPLDFTSAKTIGARINLLAQTRGYDHNYVLKNSGGELIPAARVYEPRSGRVMEVQTTEPGMQFYTANGMRGIKGKGGKIYNNHYGFCLETQHFPDSPNKPHFPSVVLRPGEKFNTITVFTFSTR